ncbi:MAG: hypothetical protein RIQ89_1133 [Bacteroidota bacterium]|jgi:RND family efflux transporter MFP subunit
MILLAACGSDAGSDKKAQLEKLKTEQAARKAEIEKLEAELSGTDTTKKAKSKTIQFTEMAPQNFTRYIEVQASVDGDEDVMLSAQVPGTIVAVTAEAGDKVTKGTVLARLDDRALQQGIEATKVQLNLATTLYNKQKNLWDQKIGSEVQYLSAKANKDALEKSLAAQLEQADMHLLKSPINGTVDMVGIKVGAAVAPGFPSFRIVNLNKLKVVGEVAESYIAIVKTGNQVKLFFPDTKNEIAATLSYAGRAINPMNRTFTVEAKLANNANVNPNQTVVMKIADYKKDGAMIVPVGAVMNSTDGEYVFVVSNEGGKNIARRKVCKSGVNYNGTVEILEGIANGDKVITLGYQNLVDGDLISF